jgi:capsular exopolysaccharide synthesis family protein
MSELSPYLIRRTGPGRNLLALPRRNDPPVEDGIGVDELWRVIRRRLWLTVPLVLSTLLITTVVLFLMTPSYTAQTKLLIEPDAPQLLNMTQLIEESAGSGEYDYYRTQFELLKSRVLAARVIKELNLAQDPTLNPKPPKEGSVAYLWNQAKGLVLRPFQTGSPSEASAPLEYSVDPAIIDTYLKLLEVEPILATRLVTVSFSLPDPGLAARVANAHVHNFVKQELEIHSGAQRAAGEFLKSQLIVIGKRVEQAEAALNAYRQHNGVLSFDVEDRNKVVEERMSLLTRALTDAETKSITAQSLLELVQHGDYDSLPQVVNNPTISALKPQLISLEAEYARLSAAFNPAYPKMVELKAQLDQDQREMAAQIRNVAAAVRRDYRAALAQETQLRGEIEAEKQRDLALNDALLKDAVLSREVQTNRDLYKNVMQRMDEMSVSAQTPLSNISVVENAVRPLSPSRPKKRKDLAISGVGALLIALALSFGLEQLDKRLKTPAEIEAYLNLPTLAIVPNFAKLAKSRRAPGKTLSSKSSRTAQGKYTSVMSKPASPLDKPPLALDGYSSGRGEIYRMIRTNILFSRAGSPPKTVLFTSAIESEGKTWTAINTAAAFAHTGAATLLISADLRRPRCDRLLDCHDMIGLSDVLVGRCDLQEVIRSVNGQGFFFLSAGSRVPNAAELLSSVRMRQVVDSLAKRYPFVLLDSAPMMHASESLAVATMVDGVVMVVGASTPKQSVRAACDRLTSVEAKVLGVVLNGVNIKRPDYHEHTRYYYQYEDHEQERHEGEVIAARDL